MLYSKEEKIQPEQQFYEEDLIYIINPHEDALVVVNDIVEFDVKRVLVDGNNASKFIDFSNVMPATSFSLL